MSSRWNLALLALLAAGASWPAAAPADEPAAGSEVRIVSSELMDTIEQWSSPTVSAEMLALDSRPELIEEYAALAVEHHEGRPLADVFAERLPATWAEIQATLGGADGETPADAEILAFAIAGGGEEYQAWQAELAESGADFTGFIATRHPEVLDELAAAGPSPAAQGVGLAELAEAKGTGGPLDLMELEEVHAEPLKRCYCWTAVSFDDQPGPNWKTQVNDNYSSGWGWPVHKSRDFSYRVDGRGVARHIEFNRRSEHNEYQEERFQTGNSSAMRVTLQCTDAWEPGLRACSVANACTGKIYAKTGYASRAYMNYGVGGPWSRDSDVEAADFVRATYQAPVGSPATLFAKGVAVAGSHDLDWGQPFAFANFLYSGQGIPFYAITTSDPNRPVLGANLNNPAANGFAGMMSLSGGVTGNFALTMKAEWYNLAQPILFQTGQTHTFKMATSSRFYGRGYGGQSDTRGHVDSAAFLVAMARSYSCSSAVIAPVDRVFWNYGRGADAPYTLKEVQDLIRDFANYAGSGISTVNSTPGQFPQ